MANISKPLNQGFAAPNIVANYGPYSSVAAAHTALSEDGLNVVGMTVGIKTGDTITEYWYKGGTTQSHLVQKHVSNDELNALDSKFTTAIDNLENITGDSLLVTRFKVVWNLLDSAEDIDTIINKFHEIVSFLEGIDENRKLKPILDGITSLITEKANKNDVYLKSETYTKDEVDAAIEKGVTISTTKNQTSEKLVEGTEFRVEAGAGVKVGKWGEVDNSIQISADTDILATKTELTAKADKADTYTKEQVDAAIEAIDVSEQLEDVAFLGNDDGQAVIPEFDPQTDTLLKITQSLTNTEKETVIGNILDKNYIGGSYIGKGKKYLKLNVGAPVATDFDGFVDGVTTEQSSLAEVPDNVYFDRTNNKFIASKGEGLLLKYYMSWLNGEAYMNPNSGAYFKNSDNYYQWNGTTLEAATISINKLTQADFDTESTIYVIRYDYDLNNQTITIPENCILQFDGGSLRNGTIEGQNTGINAGLVKIFNTNVTLEGTWNVAEAYPEWFGAKGDEETDDTVCIQTLFNSPFKITKFNKKYYCNCITIINKNGINISCSESSLFKRKNNSTDDSLIKFQNCYNVIIDSMKIDGNITYNGVTVRESSISLRFNGCKDVYIEKLYDKNSPSDSLYIYDSENITIDSIKTIDDDFTGRNSLSIISGKHIYINNLYSYKRGYETMPGGFDIEPNNNTEYVEDVVIANAYIYTNAKQGFYINASNSINHVNNIKANATIVKTTETNRQYSIGASGAGGLALDLTAIVQSGFQNSGFCFLTGCKNSDIHLIVNNSQQGLRIESCDNINISGDIVCKSHAIQIYNNNNLRINMQRCEGGTDTSGAASIFITGNNTNTIISGNFKKNGTKSDSCCIRVNAVTDTIYAIDMNMSGWPDNYRVYGDYAADSVFGINCLNYNYRDNNNGVDGYTKGMIIYPKNPSISGNMCWRVLESGKPGKWAKSNLEAMVCGTLPNNYTENHKGIFMYDNTNSKKPALWNGKKWIDTNGFTSVLSKGDSAQRPSNLTLNDVGYDYYDTDLKKHINFSIGKGSTLHSWLVPVSTNAFYDNDLLENEIYYIKAESSIKIYFSKVSVSPSAGDLLLVCTGPIDNFAFEAPDPIEYPYFYIVHTHASVTHQVVIYNSIRYWTELDSAKAGVIRSGVFTDKPSSTDIYVGFAYFCTDRQTTEGATDGIEIIHKGNDVWVDALGRTIS